jgi:hypothetical protein
VTQDHIGPTNLVVENDCMMMDDDSGKTGVRNFLILICFKKPTVVNK